ncbi:fibroblast growth factor 19 [Grammomys surdaster]|uniref:fibroblast growth factor 19 n=1 Tax=Grammomys surdaster TaxID=491861 RepID=UPI00109FDE73|nr:fibroblast growth factor 19 [Grammomys surdaster]
MARKLNGRAVAQALVLATLWLAVSGRPLVQQSQSVSDEDPLFLYGWGKITRLQYLYSAGPYVSNCFLHIRSDGSVDCEEDQNERNLLEFRAVALKTIAIKDVSSVRYLCMSADGKIYGLIRYSEEDCTFREEMDCLGYNQYRSMKHHLQIIFIKAMPREQLQDQKPSNFIPVFHRSFFETGDQLKSKMFSLPLESESMDPFRMVEDVDHLVKSPSFQK